MHCAVQGMPRAGRPLCEAVQQMVMGAMQTEAIRRREEVLTDSPIPACALGMLPQAMTALGAKKPTHKRHRHLPSKPDHCRLGRGEEHCRHHRRLAQLQQQQTPVQAPAQRAPAQEPTVQPPASP